MESGLFYKTDHIPTEVCTIYIEHAFNFLYPGKIEEHSSAGYAIIEASTLLP